MSASPQTPALNVLVVSKGHPFQRDSFFEMFDSFADGGIDWTHVEQPAGQVFFSPDLSAPYDVIVDYSMPGTRPGPGNEPPEGYKRDYLQLLEEGSHGFVHMHHNLCSWPSWEPYAEIVGGRFLYHPAELRGQAWPDSGYLIGVEHEMQVVSPSHPVVAGLGVGFAIQDELYLAPIFEDEIEVLMRSDFEFTETKFFSPVLAAEGRLYERGDWHHPPASNAVVWAKNYLNSPIVYIQPGDMPASYKNPNYRRLVSNAIAWVATDEAKTWAKERHAAQQKNPVPEWPQPGINRVPVTWEPRVHPDTPERTCLFCNKAGVERFTAVGECELHTVSDGQRALRRKGIARLSHPRPKGAAPHQKCSQECSQAGLLPRTVMDLRRYKTAEKTTP